MIALQSVLMAAVSLSGSTAGHEGVHVEVSVVSHVYTWNITNEGEPPITRIEIEQSNCYNQTVPPGWEWQYDPPRFAAWTDDRLAAIHPQQTKSFTSTVASRGAVLGDVQMMIGFGHDHSPVYIGGVWGPVPKAVSTIVLIAATIAAIAVVHVVLTKARAAHPAGTTSGGA